MDMLVKPLRTLNHTVNIPGDKSISHRSVMLGAIAAGNTDIHNFLPGEDCQNTVRCMRQLGIEIDQLSPTHLLVKGKGLMGLTEPDNYLDVGNSGTTMRLLSGLLAGQNFLSILTGDASIRRRPMGRIAQPLRKMGAQIWGRQGGHYSPLAIKGGPLQAISHQTPVASAQIKSAILLAGLYGNGATSVTEPALSRDHTEKMLAAFGADIRTAGLTTVIKPSSLTPCPVIVPGDISSAAFFLAAGAIIPGSRITLNQVGLNPTRTGILEVLMEMGAQVRIANQRESSGELMGDITIEEQGLRGITIGGDMIPRLIDEIPVLAVVAATAEGTTVIKDAGELKVKESNRLRAIAIELTRFGADIQETADGLIINGGRNYQGAVCESYYDHRIAMSCALMGLISEDRTVIKNARCIDISFPGFQDILHSLYPHS